jgi:hypothetical protein
MPAVVGMAGYLTGFLQSTIIVPQGNWHALGWSYDFRFAELLTHNQAAGAAFRASMQMGWANIHNAGLLMALLAYFGVRRGHAWAWVACAYGIAWGGINDAVATVGLYRETGGGVPPLPILSICLAFTGLWLTRDCLGKRQASKP